VKSIKIHREAIKELNAAIAYYEDQKIGLGLDFLIEIEQAIRKIQSSPNVGAAYKMSCLRRYVTQRFPFLIFYTELEELIWIMAIAHGKRRPDYWKQREIE
jgi:toxin ParE1/3/4